MTTQPTATQCDENGFITADALTKPLKLAVADIPAGDTLALICGNCVIEDCFSVPVCPLIEYLREPRIPAAERDEEMSDITRADLGIGF